MCVFKAEKQWPKLSMHEPERGEAMCKTIRNAGACSEWKLKLQYELNNLSYLLLCGQAHLFFCLASLPPVD